MATTINRTLADTYYGTTNHLQSTVWTGFSTTLRDASIAHAIRDCSQALGVSLIAETVNDDDYYRPDYAAYEQALFLLVNSSHTANGESAAPKWQTVDNDGIDKEKDRHFIGPEAQRWLLIKQGSLVKIARGG